MIGRLKGIIVEKYPPLITLETGGVGYEINMPIACFHELPNTGKETIIFTHFIIRDNTHLLFGFNNKQECILFRELIKTNGVGPKLALSILSSLSVLQFIKIIKRADPTVLTQLPGVGKKTAERIVIEMKDRFKKIYKNLFITDTEIISSTSEMPDSLDSIQEAVAALISLGYKPQEATKMVNKVTNLDSNSSETIIREALRLAL